MNLSAIAARWPQRSVPFHCVLLCAEQNSRVATNVIRRNLTMNRGTKRAHTGMLAIVCVVLGLAS